MSMDNVAWLNHLEKAVEPEGYGNKLSMYLIALEAWRRGIKVKFYTIDNPENKLLIRYSLEYEGRTHYFESSLGDKLSSEAFDVCEYKDLTKKYLSEAGVKVPEGKVFAKGSDKEQILNYAKTIKYPVVVKPLNENAGKGVFSNVKSEKKLLTIIDHLYSDLSYKYIMIEEYISGEEYRIVTVNGKYSAAVKRIPANIIGNGKYSIKRLIKNKNKSKIENPAISKKRIKLDEEINQILESAGYTEESVLEKDQQLFLRTKSNISAGGDPVDVTEKLPEDIINVAEKATNAIPGLNVAGLDFIIHPETGEYTIIEINTKPMIGLHAFPVQGKARDVIKSIVDLYFPETESAVRSNLYFDFNSKIEPLDNVTVCEVQVHPLKYTGVYETKEFILKLESPNPGLTTEIRLEALKSGIHGYVIKINNYEYRIVAASETREGIEKFKTYLSSESDKFKIEDIDEIDWKYPVNTGFYIYKETVKDLNEKLSRQENEFRFLSSQMKKVEEKLEHEKDDNREKQEELVILKEEEKLLVEKLTQVEEDYVDMTLKLGEIERAYKSSVNLLKQELKSLRSDYDVIWKKYKGTVNSKSWKITKPLRKFNIAKKK